MPLATGTRLGVYEILAPIGVAACAPSIAPKDRMLEREVASKVHVLEALAQDPDGLVRFARKAKVLSSLNHQVHAPRGGGSRVSGS